MCWFQICRRGDAWGELGPEVKWLNPQWGHLLLHLVIYPLPLFAGMRRNSLEVTSKLQTWTWLYFIAKNIWKHVVWPSSMNLRYIEMMTKSCLSYLFVYDVPLAMFCPKPKCRQCLMPASLVTKYVQWENSWVSAGKVERACCLNEEFP